MPRPSVIPAVKERLEHYLELIETQYLAQPGADRKATLPYTGDFKANVRAIAKAIELRETQEKYLYEREELRTLIDMVAEGQGLQPIGARTQEHADQAIKQRMALQAKSAQVDAQAAVEAEARVEALAEELRQAQQTIVEQQSEIMRLRTQLDMVQSGMFVVVDE